MEPIFSNFNPGHFMGRHLHLLCLAVVCCVSLDLYAQTKELSLKAGELIGIQIAGVEPTDASQINHSYRISDQGTITLLHLEGDVRAAGLTPSELGGKISKLYQQQEIYLKPVVTVSLDTKELERFVSVGGGVKKPGAIVYRPGLKVAEAIDAAGGPTAFGSLKKVKLIRNGAELRTLNLSKASSMDNEVALEPGDRVVIPE